MNDPAALAGRAVASESAAIASLVPTRSGISVAATGSHETGVGRVEFVLIDLTSDPLANVVDRKGVDYAKPPKHVVEAWESTVALAPAHPYRVLFHVYDRSGVNLVAYDRRDFAYGSEAEREGRRVSTDTRESAQDGCAAEVR